MARLLRGKPGRSFYSQSNERSATGPRNVVRALYVATSKTEGSRDSYVAEMEPPTPTSEQRRQLDEQPKKSSCKAKFASFCFTFIVFLFVLVSAALSKVCFANIAAQLNANSSVGNGSDGGKRRSIAFVQLVLVLCVPQVVTILKTLFLGILGKTTKRFPWPTWKALLKVCVSLVPQ